jgi:hypothetical protein
MQRLIIISVVAVAVLYAWLGPLHAQSEGSIPGRLKLAGALHCLASRAEGAATSKLACTLRLQDEDATEQSFEGVLYGEGLYLVSPGEVRTLWNVLAPTRHLRPEALEGDYDVVSKHKFAYAEQRPNLLIGGMDDVVALELVAPRVDPISPATRLTLRRTG